jgi:hypothetical protein
MVGNSKQYTQDLAFVVVVAAAFAAPAFLVQPALDDFTTVRPYLSNMPASAFLPTHFFRPFEQCLRWVTGRVPTAHVPLMHGVTALGHVLSAVLLFFVLVPRGQKLARASAAIFASSAALGAAVWSLDSAIQTWSTAFGLLAVLLYRAYSQGPKAGLWLLAALGAVLWKESGLSWCLLAPLVFAFEAYITCGNVDWRRLRAAGALVLALIAAYLALRHAFASEEGLVVGDGRYNVHLSPLVWLRNGLQLGGVAATAADTVALLGEPGRRTWGVLSLLLSSPLVVIAVSDTWRMRGPRVVCAAVALVVVAMGPHLLMGHVSEMYAHPVAAAWCLALVSNGTPRPSQLRAAVVALFVATSLVAGVSKASQMIETGKAAARVGAELARQWPYSSAPRTLCLVPDATIDGRGYSVFQAPGAKAAMWGRALSGQWGWRFPESYIERASAAECRGSGADGVVFFGAGDTAVLEAAVGVH